jgi:hypothetical protein
MGNGIIIVERNELDKTLKRILCPENKSILQHMKDTSYSYWHRDKNQSFIVESYETSKPIPVNGKLFNGTMRVVFVLTHDLTQENDIIDVHFLGSYWKLPILPISANGTMNEKNKSNIKKGTIPSAKVAPKDYETVKQELRKILPKIYKKMLFNQKKRFINQKLLPKPSVSAKI